MPNAQKNTITEYSLDIDQFYTPKEYKNFEAIGILIMRLFLLDPGTIQSNPEMGIGLISKFKYMNSDRVPEFIGRSIEQIHTYLDKTALVDMEVSFIPNMNIMEIFITVNNILYKYYYDQKNYTLRLIQAE